MQSVMCKVGERRTGLRTTLSLQTYCVSVSFFFSSRRRHTRFDCDWSSDVCSSDLCRCCSAASTASPLRGRSRSRHPLRIGRGGPPSRRAPVLGLTSIVWTGTRCRVRSEEHTSELQSQSNLVCRLLLEKKKTAHIQP